MISVNGAGRGIYEPFHAGVSCGNEHVHEPVDVRLVRGERIGNRTRNAAKRGLVQDEVDTLHRLSTIHGITDVAFNKGEVLPSFFTDRAADILEVMMIPGGEII